MIPSNGIGLSLGIFGVSQTLVQAFCRPAAGRAPSHPTGVTGMCIALTIMALDQQGWIIFTVMPLFAMGGIGTPALQSLASRQVEDGKQGQFQGVLASVVSLASIVAPLGFSSFYLMVRPQWPGGVWLSVVALYAIGALLARLIHRT